MIPFVILAAFIHLASALTANTPMGAVVCQPLHLGWTPDGSPPPYYLTLIPAGQPAGSPLKQFPPQQGNSYTWSEVTLGAGTSFTFCVKDGNGQQWYSGPATVQDGDDKSCVTNDVKEGKEASASGSATPTSVYSGVAAVNHGTASGTSSSPSAAAASTPSPSITSPASPKSEAVKGSGGSASPSQSGSAKANNSVARDISSGAVVGIMFAVGLTSIVVSLVV
ncbi:hypothetical protein BJV74DRAFT_819037 [Russula compacta]|nr:hypothetical protein BJV74DRAFT_819037 [Russula compacta]